eukprot:3634479-Prymnesium_polylepis.1
MARRSRSPRCRRFAPSRKARRSYRVSRTARPPPSSAAPPLLGARPLLLLWAVRTRSQPHTLCFVRAPSA